MSNELQIMFHKSKFVFNLASLEFKLYWTNTDCYKTGRPFQLVSVDLTSKQAKNPPNYHT